MGAPPLFGIFHRERPLRFSELYGFARLSAAKCGRGPWAS